MRIGPNIRVPLVPKILAYRSALGPSDRPRGTLSVICPSMARAGVKTAQPLDRLTLQSNPARSEVPPLPVQKDTAWKKGKNRTEGGSSKVLA